MRILGLDPGSQHTGYGVIEKNGSRLEAIAQGRFTCKRGMPLAERLVFLSRSLDQGLNLWRPDAVALEGLFHGVNSRSLIVLAQARGALLVRLAERELEIHELAPAQVKNAVTGNGRATKDQVQRMVRLLLNMREEKITTDAADALALAICLSQRHRVDRLARASTRPSRKPEK